MSISLNVTNTGERAGATPIIVTYSRITRGVIRYARELCGFTKVFLQPKQSKTVTVAVRVSDLARWDTSATPPTDARPVRVSVGLDPVPHGPHSIASGAYVVDGGSYTFFAAGCVANSVLADIHHSGDPMCPFYESAVVGKAVVIGREGGLYGAYM